MSTIAPVTPTPVIPLATALNLADETLTAGTPARDSLALLVAAVRAEDGKARDILRDRADSYSRDAQTFADMPRLGQTSEAMTEEECKTYAVMYRTIADELRKVAADL